MIFLNPNIMINYKLASSTWDDNELRAIQSVIDKDMYTMSDSVLEFENKFAGYVGSDYAVMVNSGSSANLLSVAALFYTKSPKLKRGDEVIVPAVSWSTTYYPLYQYGLKLKFVDVDLNTLNYDLEALEKAVGENTKMIMVVNLLGNPNDFVRINEIIDNRDIILVEDNCESMGATFNGKQTGTFGLMGTFSTFFSHHMSTMEGGLVVTDDEELYHVLLSLRAHGWTRNLPDENWVSNKSEDWFTESFRFLLPGYNVRPLEMSGAIGIEQLKKLPGFLEQRRKNAKYFVKLFEGHKDFLIQKDIDNSSWFGFSLIIRPESNLDRMEVVNKLKVNQIECRPIVTGDFTKNEVLRYFDYKVSGSLKNAKYLDANGLFVGNHQIPLTKEIDHLYEVLER
ncbi:MAG: DegT/DnrJ/EryC1/StrS family aminotransferase [Allomuricauda sp.]